MLQHQLLLRWFQHSGRIECKWQHAWRRLHTQSHRQTDLNSRIKWNMPLISSLHCYLVCFLALGSRDKNAACHFISRSPWWSPAKLLSGNPLVCRWPPPQASPLICWKGNRPRCLGRSSRPMKPEQVAHFDVRAGRKECLVVNSLSWRSSFVTLLLLVQNRWIVIKVWLGAYFHHHCNCVIGFSWLVYLFLHYLCDNS